MMVMVRCALCGKKVKMKKAVKRLIIEDFYWFGEEKEVENELYFCSEDHRKAWVLDYHIWFFGDTEQAKDHLIKLHGWSEEDVDKAFTTLTLL